MFERAASVWVSGNGCGLCGASGPCGTVRRGFPPLLQRSADKLASWDDGDIKRFLRARMGNVRDAVTNIQETLVFRKTYGLDTVSCWRTGTPCGCPSAPFASASFGCAAASSSPASYLLATSPRWTSCKPSARTCTGVLSHRVGLRSSFTCLRPVSRLFLAHSYGLRDKENYPVLFERFGKREQLRFRRPCAMGRMLLCPHRFARCRNAPRRCVQAP